MHKPAFVLLLATALFTGCSSDSSNDNTSNSFTILSPENGRVLYRDTVEIVISLNEHDAILRFQACLNGREITDRFKESNGELRALVGPDDGLVINTEEMNTTRDDKGVWFVQGGSYESQATPEKENYLTIGVSTNETQSEQDESVFYVDRHLHDALDAMGYAVATDRLWQAELTRRAARGTLSEVLGPDQLQTDVFMRTIGYSQEELDAGFDSLDEQEKAIISGYVSGFNRRIQEIRQSPNLLPFEFAVVNAFPKEWRESDVLAIFAFLQRNFDPEALDQDQVKNGMLLQHLIERFPESFLGMFDDLRWINDPKAQTFIETKSLLSNQRTTMQRLDKSFKGDPKPQKAATGMGATTLPDFRTAGREMMAVGKSIRENLKKINARVKMGSYAWVVSGKKTVSGNPILYAGPQMGFSVPSIVTEGSINAGGLNVSGMTVPGIPGILLGRTPHHAWSLQVGHAHTTDYYIESPEDVFLDRNEVIHVAGQEDMSLRVYRTVHGPVVHPMPYDPEAYVPSASNPILSWRYAHAGYEFSMGKAIHGFARATTLEEFDESVELLAVSQHICYADQNGNIAYWMSGRDPVRPESGEYRLPQGALGQAAEWDDTVLKPRSHDSNPERGFFGGWNNKSSADYDDSCNSNADIYGPFQRAHVIESYLSAGYQFSFEDLRDLALKITTTESFAGPFNGGGNPWIFVEQDFTEALMQAGLTPERKLALDALNAWDGHFVIGGPDNWVTSEYRAGAWVLLDAWLEEVIRLTFEDELPKDLDEDGNWEGTYLGSNQVLLFNVIIHALDAGNSGVENQYDWFSNFTDPDAPQDVESIIVAALDTVMLGFGKKIPRDVPRGEITYTHDILGEVWQTPYAFRSTYAQVVEVGNEGPVRVESMFPLGESGEILMGNDLQPVFNPHFFSTTTVFDNFQPRAFPVPSTEIE